MNKFLRYFLPSLALVPLFFFGGMAVTVVRLVQQVPIYRASAQVMMPAPGNGQSKDAYEIQANTDLQMASGTTVVSGAREMLNRPAEEIAEKLVRLDAAEIPGTRLATFAVDALEPSFAADFANAWAESFASKMSAERHLAFPIAERASPPSSPVTPRRMETIFTNAIISACIGIGAAAVLAWIILIAKNK
jgi:capsular polysaccharide biosynthesis protein